MGGVAALALIAVGGFFLLRRMRSEDDEDDEYYEPKAVSRGALKKKNGVDMPLQNPLNPFAHHADARTGHGGLTDNRMKMTMMGGKRGVEGKGGREEKGKGGEGGSREGEEGIEGRGEGKE